jgi:hypothetical protein
MGLCRAPERAISVDTYGSVSSKGMSMKALFMVAGAVALAASMLISPAAAGGKVRECKPGAAPSPFGEIGAIATAQPVDYWGEAWLLVTDKQAKPEKVRLISAAGRLLEFGKPPSTVEPIHWLARGRALYALGKGRSQSEGKIDLVLMRWGSDPRPRLTVLRTTDALEGQMTGAFTNEFLMVSWAERAADKKLHRMASFLDSEELRVPEPQDLGPDNGGAVRVLPAAKGFSVLWMSDQGVMRASFDVRGKLATPSTALAWSGQSIVRGLVQCGQRLWLVHDAGKELALSSGDINGPITELARLPAPPAADFLPMQCVDEAVVLGHRTLSVKEDNIVFWISTVDASGKVRDRRVKDMHGTLDDIRLPQLSVVGSKLVGWWVEGQAEATKVWSREISCE